MTASIVGGVIVALIIGLLVYFFIMRSKTIRINRKTMKKGPEHQMLSLVTVDHHNQINQQRITSSPDKIMPMPYPIVCDNKNLSGSD